MRLVRSAPGLIPAVVALAVGSFVGGPAHAQTASTNGHASRQACVAAFHSVGSALRLPSKLRLTPAQPNQDGAAWTNDKCDVEDGFTVVFKFHITNLGNTGADGFTFTVQNHSYTALGGPGMGMGYATAIDYGVPGIRNSLAVEFDTWQNFEFRVPDPSDNHISVHTKGLEWDSPDELYSLGSTTAIPHLSDGADHRAKVVYVPGTLTIYVDDFETPALTVSVDLAATLELSGGRAWVGFTASTGGAWENHDVWGISFS
jgi:Bacterial lectin